MTTTTLTSARTTPSTDRRRLWPAAVGYGLVAAAATTAVAATGHAAGISLDVQKAPIPVAAFSQVTFGFVVLGLAIAAGLRRWTADPRRSWVATTLVLTALSFVPDATADAAWSTRLLLMTTHVTAAAIVIPAIAARMPRRSTI